MDNFLSSLNRKMEPELQVHMKNVYSCLALSTLSAAVGAIVHIFTDFMAGGFISGLGSIICMLALMGTPDNGKNTKARLGYLLGFSFLSGLGLGPLLNVVIAINPAIISTAFFSTCLVFACFTIASIFSNQRQYLYLGGTLMTILTWLMIGSFLNIFMGSYLIFKGQIYLGLIAMCGFILYDTQQIMEKRRHGDRDYIWHSIGLFIDILSVFRYLLIILADKDQKKKK